MLQLNGAILMHCLAAYFPIALYVNKCRNEHKGIQILGIQGKMNPRYRRSNLPDI